jgi:hypothetical protein
MNDAPRRDAINLFVLISRWIHLGSVIIALGGAAFMRFALLPAAKATLADDVHEKLREAVRVRWAKFVHAAIALLLITGSINFAILAIPPKVAPIPYHPIFGIKLLAAFAVFFVAEALMSRGPGFAKIRANRAKWLSVLLSLGALIVLLSGILNQVRTSQQHLTGSAMLQNDGSGSAVAAAEQHGGFP